MLLVHHLGLSTLFVAYLGSLQDMSEWSSASAIRIGFTSDTSDYAAISMAVQQAQANGLLTGENFR